MFETFTSNLILSYANDPIKKFGFPKEAAKVALFTK